MTGRTDGRQGQRTLEAPFATDEERDHSAAIGMVASEWAFLELMIDFCTIHILGLEEDAASCLTAQVIGPARKLDAFISAARLRGADSRALNKEMESFARDTTILAEHRNRNVHDSWVLWPGHKDIHRYEVTARKKLNKGPKRTSTKEVFKLAFDIVEHSNRFDTLFHTIMAEIQKGRPIEG